MIWGITLEPGQAHTEVIEDEVHLSMATMESRGCIGSKADNFSHVVIKTGTTEYLLCTLVNGITYQQCLDLKLMPSDKVTFTVQGTNVVYLTGYSYVSSEADQEIPQTEDWIEDQELGEDVPQNNQEYSEDDSRFEPLEVHAKVQNVAGEDDANAEMSDREQYSLQYEVPTTAEQQYQSLPPHHQTEASTSSSHSHPQQYHPQDTDESNLAIKEEIHTIVETEEDSLPDQGIYNQPESQPIHQPSTSKGQIGSLGFQSTTRPLSQSSNTPVDIWKSSDGDWNKSHNESRSTGCHDRNITMESSSLSVGVHMRISQGRNMQAGTTHDPQRCKEQLSQGHSVSGNIVHSNVRSAAVGDRTSWPTSTDGSNGEKSYHCRFCLRGFRFPSSVRAHERVHTGERPYMCRFCFKRFKKSDHKNTHERTHTGERPYGCNVCSKRFKQLGHLREHAMTHRKDKK